MALADPAHGSGEAHPSSLELTIAVPDESAFITGFTIVSEVSNCTWMKSLMLTFTNKEV